MENHGKPTMHVTIVLWCALHKETLVEPGRTMVLRPVNQPQLFAIWCHLQWPQPTHANDSYVNTFRMHWYAMIYNIILQHYATHYDITLHHDSSWCIMEARYITILCHVCTMHVQRHSKHLKNFPRGVCPIPIKLGYTWNYLDSHGYLKRHHETSSIVKPSQAKWNQNKPNKYQQIMVSHAPCPCERILKYCKVLACTNASQVHLEAFGLSSQGIRISPHLNNVKMCKGN